MDRYTCATIATTVWLCSLLVAVPLVAQDSPSPSLREAAEAAAAQLTTPTPRPTVRVAPPPRANRPAQLLPLYLSFGALQALDIHSTSGAIDRGAVEGNPIVRPLASNAVGMIAVKTATTTAVIYTSERMWKKNRTAAVIVMVATNFAMAWVVQHNYRAAR